MHTKVTTTKLPPVGVATLALGLWPGQDLTKVRTKSEARESHFMLPRMWENVREWTSTLPVSSHFGSWSPDGLLNLGCGESCESVFVRSSFMHQKCFDYALTNLFGLCRSMWIDELLVVRLSPIPQLQHAPLPLKCYEPGSAPQLLLLLLSSPLDL